MTGIDADSFSLRCAESNGPYILLSDRTYTSVRNVSATYVFNENYYVSRYRYLGSAMTVIILATLSVIPT